MNVKQWDINLRPLGPWSITQPQQAQYPEGKQLPIEDVSSEPCRTRKPLDKLDNFSCLTADGAGGCDARAVIGAGTEQSSRRKPDQQREKA